MKKLLLFVTMLASLLATVTATAQTSGNRAALLQSSRNMVMNSTDGQRQYYIVNSQQRYTVHRLNDSLVIGSDTLSKAGIASLRFQTIERFAVDEESSELGLDGNVEGGLLAFRRSMNIGRWNTITLPFSLSAKQVRDAFGADVLVARPTSVGESDAATLEFALVTPVNDRDVMIEGGKPYLIRPTREPDIAEGASTTTAYGSRRIAGPVYLVDRVCVGNSDPKTVAVTTLRSSSRDTNVRLFGSFTASSVEPTLRPMYILNDEGRFALTEEKTPINGFRTWIEVTKNTGELPVRFFINGIEEDLTQPTDIKDVERETTSNHRFYDLQGRRLGSRPRSGIYVVNGKKVVIR